MPRHILVVDDDPHIREVVLFAIEKAGMSAEEAGDGAEALNVYSESKHHMIILDISMPEMDGLDVCREIRKYSDVPILFLSARDEEVDRIVGLEIGGDDYLTKPFSPRELVARIKAILKRTLPQTIATPEAEQYQLGALRLMPGNHQVFWNEQEIKLTATEFAVVKGMIQHPDMVYSRDQIMNFAYDHDIYVSDRTIDSHIRHIRKKFNDKNCPQIIGTIHGVGYKLLS